MSSVPPPIPAKDTIFHKLAHVSWFTVIIAFVVNVFFGNHSPTRSREEVVGSAVFAGLIILVGIGSGIVALFGIPRYGRKGILAPALTGLCIWIVLLLIAIPTILAAKALANRHAVLTPAIHAPNARHIDVSDLGFSFDLPDGFEPFDPAMMQKGVRLAYLIPSNDPAKRVIAISQLAGAIPHTPIPDSVLATNRKVTLQQFGWRGLTIDGFRVPELSSGIRYVTFNVQVPLKGKAVQISFGGRADDEASIRATAETLLSSLEGETNW